MVERGARLSHVDARGKARMVEVGMKPPTRREAIAAGRVYLGLRAFRQVRRNQVSKGDVLGVARVAGILAAKKTGGPLMVTVPLRYAR